MLQVSPTTRIFLARKPVDFRKGIDSLAAVCRSVLGNDPFSGAVFLFTNRRRTAVKILTYDGQGFWLCMKRLSRGRFRWWPVDGAGAVRPLDVHELTVLLWNEDPTRLNVSYWRRVQSKAQ